MELGTRGLNSLWQKTFSRLGIWNSLFAVVLRNLQIPAFDSSEAAQDRAQLT